MEKIKIEVPEGIRFLSDWEEFKLANFPAKCIINKQIPGCGFTEYCIRSNENIILCSPRKILLYNKWDQHKSEVYLVVNEMDKDVNVDKDLNKELKDRTKNLSKEELEEKKKEAESRRHEIYQKLYSEIEEYKIQCFIKQRPMKILVTYDSYHIVIDILRRLSCFEWFYTVIDEFQSILHDSRFKSDTELGFLEILKQSNSAIFASATPMMDEYLDLLDEFNTLPYYELDWYTQDPSRVVKPSLKVQLMRSVGEKAKEIIDSYLQGDFEEIVVMRDGIPTKIVSTEAVLYVNSVNHIISIIKKLNLQPDQVNILCSDTEENQRKIRRKLGKNYSIGKVPKKGESHKMFTFCTRTVYLGADFYSEVARSFIMSDANSDCLAVDISEDLPQILGRQRLFENPWKNTAEFYYRATADYRRMTWEDFEQKINYKRSATEDLLMAFESAPTESSKATLAKSYKDLAVLKNYKDDYVAVNKIRDESGNIILKPVLNNLVLVNELRAFRIQQIDYKDRFTVFTTIHEKLTHDDIINQEAAKFMEIYFSTTTRYEKFKLLCESNLSQDVINLVLSQIADSDEVKSYYTTLGPQRLKALSYDINRIRRELGIVVFSKERLIVEIYSNFHVGEKYTLANLKTKLGMIYSSINYDATPKANDIENWFEIKEVSMYEKKPDGGRRRIRVYELVGPKKYD